MSKVSRIQLDGMKKKKDQEETTKVDSLQLTREMVEEAFIKSATTRYEVMAKGITKRHTVFLSNDDGLVVETFEDEAEVENYFLQASISRSSFLMFTREDRRHVLHRLWSELQRESRPMIQRYRLSQARENVNHSATLTAIMKRVSFESDKALDERLLALRDLFSTGVMPTLPVDDVASPSILFVWKDELGMDVDTAIFWMADKLGPTWKLWGRRHRQTTAATGKLYSIADLIKKTPHLEWKSIM